MGSVQLSLEVKKVGVVNSIKKTDFGIEAQLELDKRLPYHHYLNPRLGGIEHLTAKGKFLVIEIELTTGYNTMP